MSTIFHIKSYDWEYCILIWIYVEVFQILKLLFFCLEQMLSNLMLSLLVQRYESVQRQFAWIRVTI